MLQDVVTIKEELERIRGAGGEHRVNPFPLILSSPSGGGKTTITRMLIQRRSDVGYSTSCTTRRHAPARSTDETTTSCPGSVRRSSGAGDFASSAEVFGNLYGTLRSEVERVFATGKHVVADIDVQERPSSPSRPFLRSVLIFLLPVGGPLKRLASRNAESPEVLARRLTAARDELRAVDRYHYVIVNDELERTYQQVAAIVDAETVRHRRIPLLDVRVRELVDELNRQITSNPLASRP
ncbi:MAG: guanylate kinase [Gemmatimonadaceae bacterium]